MMRSRFNLGPWLVAAALALGACQAADNSSGNAADGGADLTAPYVSTEMDIVRVMLDLAAVRPEDLVVDLGSGDGRIPILAAQLKGARGLGIELNRDRIDESNRNAARAGVTERVQFRQQDLFVTPLNDATVLTLYLLPEINLQLRPKILAQMAPGTRVVSNSFDMGDWRPDRRENVGGTNIFLWIVPARVEGRWQVQFDNGRTAQLDLEQRYQDVTGLASASGAGGTIEGRLDGAAIALVTNLGEGRRRYQGRVQGNMIVGDGWRAMRVG
jgi:SAM-dependent methyltransferase